MDTNALHAKATEFTDEALLAKSRGDKAVAQSFFEKAFMLEKEAALAVQPNGENTQLYRSILFRSAATLALDCGFLWEGRQLADLALSTDPHPAIVVELEEVASQLKERLQQTALIPSVTITGIVTGADAGVCEIKVQPAPGASWRKVLVPREQLHDIVLKYWEKNVVVEGKEDWQGVIFLKSIRQAA